MEAKELRIGNKVYYKLGEQLTIYTIDNGQQIDIYKKCFEPIPLTTEWLERFGFEKHHADFYNDIITVIQDLVHKGEWIILFQPCNLSSAVLCRNKSIKYVHQLQNLYAALTGEELTLKQELPFNVSNLTPTEFIDLLMKISAEMPKDKIYEPILLTDWLKKQIENKSAFSDAAKISLEEELKKTNPQ